MPIISCCAGCIATEHNCCQQQLCMVDDVSNSVAASNIADTNNQSLAPCTDLTGKKLFETYKTVNKQNKHLTGW